jgi:hypothetical protein
LCSLLSVTLFVAATLTTFIRGEGPGPVWSVMDDLGDLNLFTLVMFPALAWCAARAFAGDSPARGSREWWWVRLPPVACGGWFVVVACFDLLLAHPRW